MSSENRILRLQELKEKARLGGGKKRIQSQHERGKFTARERVTKLLDKGSFEEFDEFVTHQCTDFEMDKNRPFTDGVITGYGTVHGRMVFVFAQDFTIFGGSLSMAHAEKIIKVMDMAARTGAPLIGINDSGGARIQEGVVSLAGYAEIFLRNVLYSGVIPQISVVMGPCAGGAVYSPAITDFVFMTEDISYMFLTGPKVLKQVTQEEISAESLGGASVHATKSGVAHFVYPDEDETFKGVRRLLSYIPQKSFEAPPIVPTSDPPDRVCDRLNTIVPESQNRPYDMKEIIKEVMDNNDFFEVQPKFAGNVVIGFGRLNGRSIGVVANQPKVLAGVLDNNASMKAARFIRFCDAFSIPLLVFEDVPGFMPGANQEHNGIIRNGAKLLYAFAEATVPKVTVIVRKAYGGAYCVMNSKHIRGDISYAWPTAEIAVMGPDGAVEVLYSDEIKKSEDPQKRKNELKVEYSDKFAGPYMAAQRGYVDDVIVPSSTRAKLVRAFTMLQGKHETNPKKKHGNIPL
ncbi:MAG TPA: acyl-CoA carboxylase subunit beta [Bacteroidota bacterium]|nr:acyl-CoA carboxylase subunit beta [Bacteroidota bacterium]